MSAFYRMMDANILRGKLERRYSCRDSKFDTLIFCTLLC